MATLVENANRIAQAKADIKTAIRNKGVTVSDSAKIETYPALIDQIDSGIKIYSKSCDISEGTWTGPILTNQDWVNLTTDSEDSEWTYYHNLNLDINKIQFLCANLKESSSGIRVPRGYAKNSTTTQYQYIPNLSAYHMSKNYDYLAVEFECNTVSYQSSSPSFCAMRVCLYPNFIKFMFVNYGRNFFAVKITPTFEFTFGYTD